MLQLCGANMWGGTFPLSSIKKPKHPVILYVDTTYYNGPGIYLQVEPNAIYDNRAYLLEHWAKYTYILTFDDALLHLPNSKKYIHPSSTWISVEYANSINIDSKKYQISSLTGSKASTDGHRFRLDILNRKGFPIPSVFYRTNVPPMTPKCSDKIHLFREFQFSLVIENSRQTNYFTEKLCDCLYTKTIPVYYGAPNISEYFDTTGWLILDSESVDTLLEKLAQLDKDWYRRHLDTVEKNYLTVQQYLRITDNVNRALETIENY